MDVANLLIPIDAKHRHGGRNIRRINLSGHRWRTGVHAEVCSGARRLLTVELGEVDCVRERNIAN